MGLESQVETWHRKCGFSLVLSVGELSEADADSVATTKPDWGAEMKKVNVTFSGGHEIGKDDFGRPVVLIAAALGVNPDVFRKAFSGVRPARGRGPTREEVRRNKAALMRVLAPYHVTNERLDEVSNYYRFRPEKGELWPTSVAEAHAIVEAGELKRVVITMPGSGYSSPPQVSVGEFPEQNFEVKLHLDKNLTKNGGIAAVELVPGQKPKPV